MTGGDSPIRIVMYSTVGAVFLTGVLFVGLFLISPTPVEAQQTDIDKDVDQIHHSVATTHQGQIQTDSHGKAGLTANISRNNLSEVVRNIADGVESVRNAEFERQLAVEVVNATEYAQLLSHSSQEYLSQNFNPEWTETVEAALLLGDGGREIYGPATNQGVENRTSFPTAPTNIDYLPSRHTVVFITPEETAQKIPVNEFELTSVLGTALQNQESVTEDQQQDSLAGEFEKTAISEAIGIYIAYSYLTECLQEHSCIGEQAEVDSGVETLEDTISDYSSESDYLHWSNSKFFVPVIQTLVEASGWDTVEQLMSANRSTDSTTLLAQRFECQTSDAPLAQLFNVEFSDDCVTEDRPAHTTNKTILSGFTDTSREDFTLYDPLVFEGVYSEYERIGIDTLIQAGFLRVQNASAIDPENTNLNLNAAHIYPYATNTRPNQQESVGFVFATNWGTENAAAEFAEAYINQIGNGDVRQPDPVTYEVNGDSHDEITTYRIIQFQEYTTIVGGRNIETVAEIRPEFHFGQQHPVNPSEIPEKSLLIDGEDEFGTGQEEDESERGTERDFLGLSSGELTVLLFPLFLLCVVTGLFLIYSRD